MPREVIHDDTIHEGTTNSTPFAVEVQWGRDMDVSVGTIDLTKELGTMERGYFTTLDRRNINKLIRALRRARDQAYGRDE